MNLIDFLNDIHQRKASIPPYYKKKKYVPVLEIFRLLPGTNCGECSRPSCLAFAVEINNGMVTPDMCPYFTYPFQESVTCPVFMERGKNHQAGGQLSGN